jgi:threonine dehydratase
LEQVLGPLLDARHGRQALFDLVLGQRKVLQLPVAASDLPATALVPLPLPPAFVPCFVPRPMPPSSDALPVTPADVVAAAERLDGVAHRTPVMTSRTVDARTGAEAVFKCENFQRVGAFKFRGAYNALAQFSDAQKERGVVAYSSGNHAQAIALAGRLLNIPAVIVMPETAPAVKLEATRGYGAEIVPYDPDTTVREELAAEIAEARGLTLIPSFDHPAVIAGQGTAGLELFEEVDGLDCLLVCCGGAGLLSGCALAAEQVAPDCRIVGVEPAAGDDATRSFYTGERKRVDRPDTVADGARTAQLGDLTFPLVLEYVDDMVTVPDDALLDTMQFLWERLKIVVEPTGALAATALLTEQVDVDDRRVGVLVTGGNVDLGRAGEWFA